MNRVLQFDLTLTRIAFLFFFALTDFLIVLVLWRHSMLFNTSPVFDLWIDIKQRLLLLWTGRIWWWRAWGYLYGPSFIYCLGAL